MRNGHTAERVSSESAQMIWRKAWTTVDAGAIWTLMALKEAEGLVFSLGMVWCCAVWLAWRSDC